MEQVEVLKLLSKTFKKKKKKLNGTTLQNKKSNFGVWVWVPRRGGGGGEGFGFSVCGLIEVGYGW